MQYTIIVHYIDKKNYEAGVFNFAVSHLSFSVSLSDCLTITSLTF